MAHGRCGVVLLGAVALIAQVGCHSASSREAGIAVPPMAMNNTGESRHQATLPPKESATACLATAKELEKAGHFEPAIQLYEKARENDPKLAGQICRRLAVLHDRQGDFHKANEEYEKALAMSPKDAELLNNIGYSYYCRGQLVEAESFLQRSLAISPHNTRAWNNLGMVLSMQNRHDESLKAFCKAVTPSQAHCNVAFVLAAQGRCDEAKAHYLKALELDPSQTLARNALAKLSEPNFGKAQVGSKPAPPNAPTVNGVQATNFHQSEQPASPSNAPIMIDPR
jgi:Flp pilus assembly protein TadD